MDRTEIWEEVKGILVDKLGESVPILNDTKIIEELGADSLDLVELVMQAEDHFDIEIADVDSSKVKTAGDITDLVDKYLKEKK